MRNQLLDATRGIIILVVILDHALQGACHGEPGVTWLHRFIMSFQMEAFFAISGFAMVYSRQPSLIVAIKHRAARLAVPYLSWVLLFYVAELALHTKAFDILDILLSCVNSGFWFLRELLVVCIALEIFRHAPSRISFPLRIILSGAVVIAFSFLPGNHLILHYSVFFFLGYLLHRSIMSKPEAIPSIEIQKNKFFNCLCWCGNNSLALYAIHWNVFFVFLSLYAVNFTTLINKGVNTYIVSAMLFAIYLSGSIGLTWIIKRIPIVRTLFI